MRFTLLQIYMKYANDPLNPLYVSGSQLLVLNIWSYLFNEVIQVTLIIRFQVGLDFSPWICKSATNKEDQEYVFREQIRQAKSLNLPVNIHSRSAAKRTVEILIEEGQYVIGIIFYLSERSIINYSFNKLGGYSNAYSYTCIEN